MNFATGNIFLNLSVEPGAEQFLPLLEHHAAKIERIVSRSHKSPADYWYEQAEDEWVIVLRGGATLEFEASQTLELKAGDYLAIPRRVRHRVTWTSEETIWLAVRIK